MDNLQVGQKVFVSPDLNSVWTGVGVVEDINPPVGDRFRATYASLTMLTGSQKGKVGGFDVKLLEPAMVILKIKRSKEDTGLKVYGEVRGESGNVYKVGYYRRENFRGWLCSCESFLLDKMAKKRNCKHLHFVRGQVGRFAATVKN